jgi:uncharacterized protein YcfJ
MKQLFLFALVLFSSLAHADDIAKRLRYDQLFVPLNESCEEYYSLNTPGKFCKKGKLYYIIYEVDYEYNRQQKTVRLTYIPPKEFAVDSQGNIPSRNHQYITE